MNWVPGLPSRRTSGNKREQWIANDNGSLNRYTFMLGPASAVLYSVLEPMSQDTGTAIGRFERRHWISGMLARKSFPFFPLHTIPSHPIQSHSLFSNLNRSQNMTRQKKIFQTCQNSSLFAGWGCLIWQPLALQDGKRPVYLLFISANVIRDTIPTSPNIQIPVIFYAGFCYGSNLVVSIFME